MNAAFATWIFLHIIAFYVLYFIFLRPDKQIVRIAKKSVRTSIRSRRKGRSYEQSQRDGRMATAGDDLVFKAKGCFLLVFLGIAIKIIMLMELMAFSWFASFFS